MSANTGPNGVKYLDKLLAIDSDNQEAAFCRALTLLYQNNPETSDYARAELKRIAGKNGDFRASALRKLIRDAAGHHHPDEAQSWSRKLVELPEARLRDKLLYLTLQGHAFTESAYVTQLPNDLLAKPISVADAALYARWLSVEGHAAQAAAWLRILPAAIITAPDLESVTAYSVVASEDWNHLAQVLNQGAWGPAKKSSLQLAFSAKSLRESGRNNLPHTLWTDALSDAGNDLSTLRVMLRLSLIWGWRSETEETLWAILQTHPTEIWAARALAKSARARNDSDTLKEVYAAWMKDQPEDLEVTAQWALLSLLGDSPEKAAPARAEAARLYAKDPLNPSFVIAHAFALYRQGSTREALSALERLRAPQLSASSRALYYGITLAAENYPAAAERFLDIAAQTALLPEEKSLLRTARERLR